MGGPRWAGVVGPLEVFEGGFAAWLSQRGYVPRVVQLQVRLMGELSAWLAAERLGAAELSRVRAGRYMSARKTAGLDRHITVKSLAPLLEYLEYLGVIKTVEAEVVADPVGAVLDRFACYLRSERGLGEGTIAGYFAAVRPFVVGRLLEGLVEFPG